MRAKRVLFSVFVFGVLISFAFPSFGTPREGINIKWIGRTFGEQGGGRMFDFSKNGQFLVAKTGERNLTLYDLRNSAQTAITAPDGEVNEVITPVISADGRFVAFSGSYGTPNLQGNPSRIYLHDRSSNSLQMVRESAMMQVDLHGISDDAQKIVYSARPVQIYGNYRIYVLDVQGGTQKLISKGKSCFWGICREIEENGLSWDARISGDGKKVMFKSSSTNLTNKGGLLYHIPGEDGLYSYNLETNSIIEMRTYVSTPMDWDYNGLNYGDFNTSSMDNCIGPGNCPRISFYKPQFPWPQYDLAGLCTTTSRDCVAGLSINGDGHYLAYAVGLPYLVYVLDTDSNSSRPISLAPNGETGDGNSFDPKISADGRYVAFLSYASNLVAGETHPYTTGYNVYLADLRPDVPANPPAAQNSYACVEEGGNVSIVERPSGAVMDTARDSCIADDVLEEPYCDVSGQMLFKWYICKPGLCKTENGLGLCNAGEATETRSL